jgi:hypothetical protein
MKLFGSVPISFQSRTTYFVLFVIVVIVSCYMYMETKADFSHKHEVLSYAQFTEKRTHLIPKYIWRTSKYPLHSAPQQIHDVLRHTAELNPDYVQIYMDDDEVKAFIEKEFPQFVRQFKSIRPGAYKADLFRLLILYKYGGVYNDIGHQYLVPLSDILDPDVELLGGTEDNKMGSFKHAIHNSMMASYPGNPLLKSMIRTVMSDVARCAYNGDPLDVTGPAALGHAFNAWRFADEGSAGTGAGAYRREDAIPRGSNVVRGMHVAMLSHDAQHRTLLLNGQPVVNTKFAGYYELMYARVDGRSNYDSMWRNNEVYDKTQTDCSIALDLDSLDTV